MRDTQTTLETRLPLTVVTHPAFLLCLAVLIVNDHVLKTLTPSWLTGKLSDFAGLFVFAVLTSCLLRGWFTTKRRLILHHLMIAVAFIVWKIGPIDEILAVVNRLFTPQLVGRTVDSTDLVALPILLLSYRVLLGNLNGPASSGYRLPMPRLSAVLVITVAGFATVATTMLPVYHVAEERVVGVGQRSAAERMYQAERVLVQAGFQIKQRWILSADAYQFEVTLDTNLMIPRVDSTVKNDHLFLWGTISIGPIDQETGQRAVKFEFRTNQRLKSSSPKRLEVIDSLVDRILVEPLTMELSK